MAYRHRKINYFTCQAYVPERTDTAVWNQYNGDMPESLAANLKASFPANDLETGPPISNEVQPPQDPPAPQSVDSKNTNRDLWLSYAAAKKR
jgi:hypothetical protein